MINKMESSCCHGNLKRSGQAQACAKNGLIGEDIDDWGLNHKPGSTPSHQIMGFGMGRQEELREEAAP